MSAALKHKPGEISDAEWRTRCDLAALYRIVHHLGWTDLINTHMSARLSEAPDCFLINRYGEMFDEITASSLIKMDLAGNVMGAPSDYNDAGLTIHSGIYKARPDAHCVMHTHTRAGAGIALIRNALRPISQDVLGVLDEVTYHTYGVPATALECEALGRSAQNGSCIVLLNHGLLAFGETIPGTLLRLYMLERAAELELSARSMNAKVEEIAASIVAEAASWMKRRRASPDYGLKEWQGLVRTIERAGADYRR
ncbi:MAG: class II aldolase/adducin family protein [Acetobacteraceae bacterium]